MLGYGALSGCLAKGIYDGVCFSTVTWHMVNINQGIGQGDMHVLRLSDGKFGAIDIGLSGDSNGVVLAALRRLGVRHLEFVVLTHYHRDHYGSIRDVLEAGITIGRLVHNPITMEQCLRESPWGCTWTEITELHGLLHRKNVELVTAAPGMVVYRALQKGVETKLEVVCAFNAATGPYLATNINDTSVVCMLTHGDMRTLFTGDIGPTVGEHLFAHAYSLEANMLKVPHHGAEATAPNQFVEHVAPESVFVTAPPKLWTSTRCQRMRTLFEGMSLPAYVNGRDGHVDVIIMPKQFATQVFSEPLSENWSASANQS